MNLTELNGKVEEWLVCQTIGFSNTDGSSLRQLNEFMNKSFIPRGGAAALMSGDIKCGKAFCFLPLQIDTHLPVHVNGTFVLDQSRRNLKKGDAEMIHRWNQLLADRVIAPAYAKLIESAGPKLCQSRSNFTCTEGKWICHHFDTLFPTDISRFSDVWKLVATSTLQYIGVNNIEILPVVRTSSRRSNKLVIAWVSPGPSSGYFDDLDNIENDYTITNKDQTSPSSTSKESTSQILRTFLQRTGFNLISCSADICQAFKDVGIEAEFITSKICIEHIRTTEKISRNFPCQISESEFRSSTCLKAVLEYCLTAMNQVTDLCGLPFELDGKNILNTFSTNNSKYFTFDGRLLPQRKNLFLHRDLMISLTKWLKRERLTHDAYNSGILKDFTIKELAKHLDSQLPIEWKGCHKRVCWNPKSRQHPDVDWIQKLWAFICDRYEEESDLKLLQEWPIIPTTAGQLVPPEISKTVFFLDNFNDTAQRRKQSDVLRTLQCSVISIKEMGVTDKSRQKLLWILESHMATPIRYSDVLSVLRYMQNAEGIVFSKQLNPKKCDVLLEYFQTACEHEILSKNDIKQLKQLQIFPMANPHHRTSIQEFVNCHTCDDDVEMENIQSWAKETKCMILGKRNTFAKLYKKLGITHIGMTEMYISYVLPRLHEFPNKRQLHHIEFVRDVLLPRASPDDEARLYELLKQIEFIPGEDQQLHKAAYFYDVDHSVFAKMIDSNMFVPKEFRTDKWHELLKRIGLKHTVTGKDFIKFAQNIETSCQQAKNQRQLRNLEKKSLILVKELQHNTQLHGGQTLGTVARIKFIPSKTVNKVKQTIHVQHNSEQEPSTKNFICFQGSVSESHEDLVWSAASILPSKAVPGQGAVEQSLGIKNPPSICLVTKHIANTCEQMAQHNACDKEDTLEKEVREELTKVVNKVMAFICSNLSEVKGGIKACLQKTRLCLVEEGSVLVRANQLVYEMDKNDESKFRPYLYRAPRELGQYDGLLRELGAQEEVTFDQVAAVLEAIKDECKEKKMTVTERDKAHGATAFLFRLLQSTSGKCFISVASLYLPTSTGHLRQSSDLHFTDLDDANIKETPHSSDVDYLIPLKQVLGKRFIHQSSPTKTDAGLIQLLPANLRPKMITTEERVLDTCIPCNADDTNYHCPLIGQLQSLFTSEDTQKVLLRLFQHQFDQPPDKEQMSKAALIEEFNNFVCVKELNTGFYNSDGNLISKRKQPRDVFLDVSEDDDFTLYFSHADVTDHESGSVFFYPLAQSINRICEMNLDELHIQYLSQTLPLPSMELKSKVFSMYNIPEYDNLYEDLSSVDEHPGSAVPPDIWCFLDDDIFNKFHPGDIAVYKKRIGEEEEDYMYIFTKVLERLPLRGVEDDLASCLRKYKIDIGEHSPIVVSVVDLFMFRRPRNDSEVPTTEHASTSLVKYTANRKTQHDSHHLPSDISKVKAQIRQAIKEAMNLPEKERNECLRRLYRMWHPDKNPHQTKLATQAFQFLQQEIKRSSTKHSASFAERTSQWNADISRENAQERKYQEKYKRQFSTSSSQQSSSSHFVPPSFTNRRPDPEKARLWYRQAQEDLKTAQDYSRQKATTSRAWSALMVQQAVEKGLKSAIFHLSGSQSMTHNLHHLVSVVCEHQKGKAHEEKLRDSINQLVKLGCDAIRPRYPEDGTKKTTGETYKNFDTHNALKLCALVLDIVREIFNKGI